MKKIALILPALNQGGVERHVLDLAAYLKKQKDFTPIVISSGGSRVADLEKAGVKHFPLNMKTKNPFKMILNIWRLAHLIRREKIDLLHVHSRAPAWVAWFAAKKEKIPYLATVHGLYGTKGLCGLKKKYNAPMFWGKYVLAVSNYTANYIRTNYPTQTAEIMVAPVWVDLKRYTPRAVSENEQKKLRQKYHVPESIPIFSIVGRLTRLKGHDYLIDACAKLKMDFRLLIVGGGGNSAYEKNLHQKVIENKLEKKIIFVGEQRDVRPFYAVSDFVISATSTKPETFGLTLLEAMAMKKPVIATAHGGALELVIDGENGFLCPPKDAGSLQQTLIKALRLNKAQAIKMQDKALRFAQNFSEDKCGQRIKQIYQKALKEKNV